MKYLALILVFCFGTPDVPEVRLPMLTASQTSGPAPLGVVFEGVSNGTGVIRPALDPDTGFRDFCTQSYEWGFDDSGSGNWGITGKSKNIGYGQVTGHVFHQPGTYDVTLDVRDPNGQVSYYEQTITVTHGNWTDYYVANHGSDTNNGLSPVTPFRTVAHAVQNASTNTRILFNKGDTWEEAVDPLIRIDNTGPGLLGSYGSGSKPIIRSTTGTTLFIDATDWRVQGLEIRSTQTAATTDGNLGIRLGEDAQNTLITDCVVRGSYVGLFANGFDNVSNPPLFEGTVAEDLTIRDSQHNGVWIGGRKIALMGLDVEGPLDEHGIRVWWADRFYIGNSTINVCPRHNLKYHADKGLSTPGSYSRNLVFSDNIVTGGSAWSVTVGPQDSISAEDVRNSLFERNIFLCGLAPGETVGVQRSILSSGTLNTYRNNIFDASGASPWYTGIDVDQRGIELDPVSNRVYNNTFYRNAAGSEFRAVRFDDGTHGFAAGNLVSLTSAPATFHVVLDTATDTTVMNNCGNLLPGFTFVSPGMDFNLKAGNSAADMGASVQGLWEDFTNALRDQNPDCGSYEE